MIIITQVCSRAARRESCTAIHYYTINMTLIIKIQEGLPTNIFITMRDTVYKILLLSKVKKYVSLPTYLV